MKNLKLASLILAFTNLACETESSISSSSTKSELLVNYWGADLSYVNEMEDNGVIYYDESGVQKDVYLMLREKGINLARYRLWHSPTWTSYSTFQDIKKSIKRAKSVSMEAMISFHYSDTWADPEKQWIPKAWKSVLTNTSILSDSVYGYTYRILKSLKQENLLPEFVQIGNEINREILQEEGSLGFPIDWKRNSALINAGIRAVNKMKNQSGKDIKIILHIAKPRDADWWFSNAVKNEIEDFDIIGLSFYPSWHQSTAIADLNKVISSLKNTFGKDVMIVETAYPWTSQPSKDNADNILSVEAPLGYRGDPSPNLQRTIVMDIAREISKSGGLGLVYWEPAWVSSRAKTLWGSGSHWENATFFNFDNKLISNGAISSVQVAK